MSTTVIVFKPFCFNIFQELVDSFIKKILGYELEFSF